MSACTCISLTVGAGGLFDGARTSTSVTVQVTPGSTCSLAYITPGGTPSTAAGLGARSAATSGLITWSFLIGGAALDQRAAKCGSFLTSPRARSVFVLDVEVGTANGSGQP